MVDAKKSVDLDSDKSGICPSAPLDFSSARRTHILMLLEVVSAGLPGCGLRGRNGNQNPPLQLTSYDIVARLLNLSWEGTGLGETVPFPKRTLLVPIFARTN